MIFVIKVNYFEDGIIEYEIIKKYPILQEYNDVFPKNLLGLPPRREFDSLVLKGDLVLGKASRYDK